MPHVQPIVLKPLDGSAWYSGNSKNRIFPEACAFGVDGRLTRAEQRLQPKRRIGCSE